MKVFNLIKLNFSDIFKSFTKTYFKKSYIKKLKKIKRRLCKNNYIFVLL